MWLVHVLPRPTAHFGIFVLRSQVAALIAYVRSELCKLEAFEEIWQNGALYFRFVLGLVLT